MAEHVARRAGRIAPQRRALARPHRFPGFGPIRPLDCELALRARTQLAQPGVETFGAGDLRKRRAVQLARPVAEHAGEGRVHSHDPSLQIRDHHAVGSALEHGAQDLVIVLGLDGDARHLRRHLDQLQVLRRGQPGLAVVHGKRAEDRVEIREDRRRPYGAQAVAHGEVPAVLPSRVGGGISRVHGLAQIGRGPARAHVGRDAQVRLDAQPVILGDIGRGHEAQPLLPGIGKQHCAAHVAGLLLDEAHQRLQHLLERRAARDALEHAALALEKRGAQLLAGGGRSRRSGSHCRSAARKTLAAALARRAASRSPA